MQPSPRHPQRWPYDRYATAPRVNPFAAAALLLGLAAIAALLLPVSMPAVALGLGAALAGMPGTARPGGRWLAVTGALLGVSAIQIAAGI